MRCQVRFTSRTILPGLVFKLVLVWLAACFFCTPALAATYYVNINTGNDSTGDGSSGNPWKTLHNALAVMPGGTHTLMVSAGTYSPTTEGSNLPLVPPPGLSLTVIGDSGSGTVLNGENDGTWTSGFLLNKNNDAFSLEFFILKNFNQAGVFLDGSGLSSQPIAIHNNVFENCYYGVKVADSTTSGAYANIERNEFSNISEDGVNVDLGTSGSAVLKIYNNLFANVWRGVNNNSSLGSVSIDMQHNTIKGVNPYHASQNNAGFISYYDTCSASVRYNIITDVNYGISDTGTGSLVTSDYNTIHTSPAPGTYVPHAGSVSAGAHDQLVNPVFTNGYHLADGSPCIDAAVGSALTDSLDGVTRPEGVENDMGCYERAPVFSFNLVFPPGDTAAEYVIRSIPYDLDNPTPKATFGPYIGTYDTTRMRIGHWDGQMQAYAEYPGDNACMMPGDSAWFLFRNGMTITLHGSRPGTWPGPGGYSGNQYLYMPLDKGWNQIGNPFDHPISMAGAGCVIDQSSPTSVIETLDAGTVTQGIFWVYNGGTYYSASKLNSAYGGWVKFYGDSGYIYFQDQTVSFPAASLNGQMDVTYGVVSANVERPPSPPGLGDGSGGGAGGGGGGCFIQHSSLSR